MLPEAGQGRVHQSADWAAGCVRVSEEQQGWTQSPHQPRSAGSALPSVATGTDRPQTPVNHLPTGHLSSLMAARAMGHLALNSVCVCVCV